GSGADLGVVVAYGTLIKAAVLDQVPMVNLHFSLLPRWRGAAPVERAILAGDTVTGVCLMALDEGLDTGPIYASRQVAIGDTESADELRERLAQLGTELLVERLSGGFEGLGTPRSQRGEPTYAPKVSREDLHLDWRRPASELARVVRCGRAWTTLDGRRLLVVHARAFAAFPDPGPVDPGPVDPGPVDPGKLTGTLVVTASGALELVEVQPEGRVPMPAADWLRGAHLGADPILGT
ncbi:MAG: methionyl-tRNA formyltransferase, partial [Acidimicrobiales bacterium]